MIWVGIIVVGLLLIFWWANKENSKQIDIISQLGGMSVVYRGLLDGIRNEHMAKLIKETKDTLVLRRESLESDYDERLFFDFIIKHKLDMVIVTVDIKGEKSKGLFYNSFRFKQNMSDQAMLRQIYQGMGSWVWVGLTG